uniref:G_PROTEIN_RECEP_F1_2 domain-containing protein n=1 Tax=Steinernema glaseri TaxID=37863 RepID=A0A1I7ZP19_9BILA
MTHMCKSVHTCKCICLWKLERRGGGHFMPITSADSAAVGRKVAMECKQPLMQTASSGSETISLVALRRSTTQRMGSTMFRAIAICISELVSYTSQPASLFSADDVWKFFHKNQSLLFTELLSSYLERQPFLFTAVFIATSALRHPTSTCSYVILLLTFYTLWTVAAISTVFYIYVTFLQRGSGYQQTDIDEETSHGQESDGAPDDVLKHLNEIRDMSYAKNPLYTVEWAFDNVIRYVVLVNPLILVFAAYATVVGSICYKNSRHPMDRSTTSNVMHKILAVCSGSTLLLLSAFLALASVSFLYAHVSQNTCENFQMRMQNDNVEQFINARNVSDLDVAMITEVLMDIKEDRILSNSAMCSTIVEPYEVSCFLTTILTVSSFLLMFVMNALSKYYMQVDSIYYWNPDDPYSTLRMFQCNQKCFPPLPVLPIK